MLLIFFLQPILYSWLVVAVYSIICRSGYCDIISRKLKLKYNKFFIWGIVSPANLDMAGQVAI